MTNIALGAQSLEKSFGALKVTSNLTLNLPPGARHAIIGPNGAGKTTLINLLSGTMRPDSGTIRIDGTDVTHLPPHRRVHMGLGRTFQINQLFPDLTPLQSVTIAICERTGSAKSMFRPISRRTAEIDEAWALLERIGLLPLAHAETRNLSYGHRRALEIGLALATRPKILLLDEPAAGVPKTESQALFDVIAALPDEIAVVFIEHNMDLVFRFSNSISVMVAGTILREGSPEEIANDPEVRAVYLGSTAHG